MKLSVKVSIIFFGCNFVPLHVWISLWFVNFEFLWAAVIHLKAEFEIWNFVRFVSVTPSVWICWSWVSMKTRVLNSDWILLKLGIAKLWAFLGSGHFSFRINFFFFFFLGVGMVLVFGGLKGFTPVFDSYNLITWIMQQFFIFKWCMLKLPVELVT